MKNFIIALCLLILAVALTAVNAVIIGNYTQDLTELADTDQAAALEKELNRLEPYLALSVNHLVLEQTQQAAAEMRVYAESNAPGAKTEYLAAKARFLSCCAEIKEGEKFTFSNIF